MKIKNRLTGSDIFESLRPEFFIMITIIAMMCWQLWLGGKLSNDGVLVMDGHGGFSVVNDHDTYQPFTDGVRALTNFDLDTCQTIAVYDSEMQTILKISFIDDHDEVDDDTYPDFVISGQNREGTFTSKASDGTSTRTVYKWYIDEKGHELLTVYTSSLAKEEMKTEQVVISYVVIILCFVMLAVITYWQIHGITNNYRNLMLKGRRY